MLPRNNPFYGQNAKDGGERVHALPSPICARNWSRPGACCTKLQAIRAEITRV
jgi:hypothetical protein